MINTEQTLHQILVLLPGFDDGQWQDVSEVVADGVWLKIEHPDFTGFTLCSEMWEHEMGVAEVLQRFTKYVENMRRRAEFARSI